ncbi:MULTISPECIES: hypothetical protein [unclassified Mesorhizobium]|uniref:hypothetical protein n=1 Tax=unclassified Mesorhizobium TaxID=325217 RepID=UPI0003CF3C2A|nr:MULTISPECIES: hypothetical protein [unclassified Mesorhizobium]ESX12290.1 hypothetical protein X766_30585 [Mesorhizobium sp. LSJC255A00]ESX22737.1 hypothetical protein X765_30165 [Mesorhizobium sp. LSHC440B00]ESX30743.1 hypothetical protein X763_29420 [Mesorhizobium sp. LSHC432A00]ESX35717.1 hypothetical protein X764_25675 [Mesorhizobium sp. LSHC440A00]ESX68942.1 hypothetical protein X757_27375 [Mesorhizobium sp. LSHC414A00]
MTAFLRNAFLAAIAVSSLAGSAMADQTGCAKNNQWGNRCCDLTSDCLGGGRGGDHDSNGGRGGQAGAK